jgi:hypothetical protein
VLTLTNHDFFLNSHLAVAADASLVAFPFQARPIDDQRQLLACDLKKMGGMLNRSSQCVIRQLPAASIRIPKRLRGTRLEPLLHDVALKTTYPWRQRSLQPMDRLVS